MVAPVVAVEALLPAHVLRLAVQHERHHGLLRVAAVVEQSVHVFEHGVFGDGVGVVPSCVAKCRLNLLLGAEKHNVQQVGVDVLFSSHTLGKLLDQLVELVGSARCQRERIQVYR